VKIISKVPLIDWRKGFPRHWNGGSPATTHVFNALSFMFPQGERFFIKVAKEVSRKKDLKLNAELEKDLKTFLLQEAAHTKHHQYYNGILEKQGYNNVAYGLIEFLENLSYKYLSSVQRLAFVCAYEHYTAILGHFLLKNPEVLSSAPHSMSLMWGWHAAEETEHKAVCFDLYQAAGGSWVRRILCFIVVSFEFMFLFLRLYCSLLWKDGSFKLTQLPKTIFQSTRFFWGKKGVAWYILFYGMKYLKPSFHPWKHDNRDLLDVWLMRNDKWLKDV